MDDRSQITHALSFDIEDWFHVVEIKASEDPATWPNFPSIAERHTRQILNIVKDADVRATFFILGWIAERYPSIVRMIADDGHEIGTHSFWHRKIYELDADTFRKDLIDSIDVINQHTDQKIRGFRAPSFSITPGSEWAFDVMREVGLEYDASLFPARRAHGGYMCELGPHMVKGDKTGDMPELPMSVLNIGPLRSCFSGGGYFRLFPQWLIEYGIRQAMKANRPTVVYLHPRDFATDCPKMPMPFHRRMKSYVGQSTTEPKLKHLLQKYPFATCYEVLQQHSLITKTKLNNTTT